jgi:hypothetical protein
MWNIFPLVAECVSSLGRDWLESMCLCAFKLGITLVRDLLDFIWTYSSSKVSSSRARGGSPLGSIICRLSGLQLRAWLGYLLGVLLQILSWIPIFWLWFIVAAVGRTYLGFWIASIVSWSLIVFSCYFGILVKLLSWLVGKIYLTQFYFPWGLYILHLLLIH